VNEVGGKVFKLESQTFFVNFKVAVLERHMSEVIRLIGPSFFGQKDNVRLVDGIEIRRL
jgi:hypothetical protein